MYTLIDEENYEQAKEILLVEMQKTNKKSRPFLSLLGYCQQHLDLYREAIQTYKLLVEEVCPEEAQYAFQLCRCLAFSG